MSANVKERLRALAVLAKKVWPLKLDACECGHELDPLEVRFNELQGDLRIANAFEEDEGGLLIRYKDPLKALAAGELALRYLAGPDYVSTHSPKLPEEELQMIEKRARDRTIDNADLTLNLTGEIRWLQTLLSTEVALSDALEERHGKQHEEVVAAHRKGLEEGAKTERKLMLAAIKKAIDDCTELSQGGINIAETMRRIMSRIVLEAEGFKMPSVQQMYNTGVSNPCCDAWADMTGHSPECPLKKL